MLTPEEFMAVKGIVQASDIEPRIAELCTALNAAHPEICTVFSCEGHARDVFKPPYVDLVCTEAGFSFLRAYFEHMVKHSGKPILFKLGIWYSTYANRIGLPLIPVVRINFGYTLPQQWAIHALALGDLPYLYCPACNALCYPTACKECYEKL